MKYLGRNDNNQVNDIQRGSLRISELSEEAQEGLKAFFEKKHPPWIK